MRIKTYEELLEQANRDRDEAYTWAFAQNATDKTAGLILAVNALTNVLLAKEMREMEATSVQYADMRAEVERLDYLRERFRKEGE